jgi:hypothetical protein
MPKPPATHTLYVLKRETRTTGRWLEIGTSNIGSDGINGTHHLDIDRLPVGGFSGRVLLVPIGTKPSDPLPDPERPGEDQG